MIDLKNVSEEDYSRVKKIITSTVEKFYNQYCDEICSKQYYKNRYLEYAIKNNHSLQCITRDYARLLYSGSALTNSENDLYHANNILTYLHNYVDFKTKQFITTLFNEFLDEVEAENEFVILFCSGRKKGFRSFEAKNRYKLLMQKVYMHLLENYDSIFSELTETDRELGAVILNFLYNSNEERDPLSDLNGYRLIVDQIGKACSEEEKITFCYTLQENLIHFFKRKGFRFSIQKDYIKSPKVETNYQSLHLKITILGTPIEIQIRTSEMHLNAEYGAASHDKVYKDTTMQNFLKSFMYDLSEGSSQISNENNGFLHSSLLMRRTISKTYDSEIPKTPQDLKPFEDLKLLEKMTRKI